jgi:hypothetical protein
LAPHKRSALSQRDGRFTEDRGFKETIRVVRLREEQLDLLPQFLVVATGRIEKSPPLFCWRLQYGMKQVLSPAPTYLIHGGSVLVWGIITERAVKLAPPGDSGKFDHTELMVGACSATPQLFFTTVLLVNGRWKAADNAC